MDLNEERTMVGWKEWAALPGLGIPALRVKVDTGARTSALHTFAQERFRRDGKKMVRFGVHPRQGRTDQEVWAEAEIVDERVVTDSGGHRQKRIVIVTPIVLGGNTWDIEVTLTNRDRLQFRMLLGRTAMDGRLVVVPDMAYVNPKPKAPRKTRKAK